MRVEEKGQAALPQPRVASPCAADSRDAADPAVAVTQREAKRLALACTEGGDRRIHGGVALKEALPDLELRARADARVQALQLDLVVGERSQRLALDLDVPRRRKHEELVFLCRRVGGRRGLAAEGDLAKEIAILSDDDSAMGSQRVHPIANVRGARVIPRSEVCVEAHAKEIREAAPELGVFCRRNAPGGRQCVDAVNAGRR
mmetsp:Transcript_46433/g.145301  ORF Transcript_46433/g.145301 Transcript_46433/m.145301 type:complete len:203 (+) Transcript_46433:761-1369(+)